LQFAKKSYYSQPLVQYFNIKLYLLTLKCILIVACRYTYYIGIYIILSHWIKIARDNETCTQNNILWTMKLCERLLKYNNNYCAIFVLLWTCEKLTLRPSCQLIRRNNDCHTTSEGNVLLSVVINQIKVYVGTCDVYFYTITARCTQEVQYYLIYLCDIIYILTELGIK